MGDLTADAYFHKIESIFTHLSDLGSSMPDEDIVTYAINGLSPKFASLATIIAHKDPFPTFDTMRSMVVTEEMRLHSQSLPSSTVTTSAAPHVLLTETSNSRGQDSRNNRDSRNNIRTEVCRNFGRGFCRWGNNCRYLHDSHRGGNHNPTVSTGNTRNTNNQVSNNTRANITSNSGLGISGLSLNGQQQLISLQHAQNALLAQFGLTSQLGQA